MTEQLLNALGRRVNHRGRVIAGEHALLEELRVPHDVLVDGLRRLEEANLVEILSPLPFIVLRLRSWSSSSRDRVSKEHQDSSPNREAHIEVPVSSNPAAAAIQQREVGGAGEGDRLLNEVLAVLGPEAHRDEFRALLAGHHPSLIHRALKRVQATKHIRVSRPALFRSLLERLSN